MATYYLSPTGNDTTGTGSISAPWFTLEKAWDNIVAGDIVYMRGGTYNYLKTQWLTGVTGTSDNIISLLNYPGEFPIIQPATGWVYDGWYYGILFQSMNYIHVKGLEVRNFKYQQTSPCRAIMAQHINNSIFENLVCHDSEMGMMLTGNSGDNLILNCDFYNNHDPYSPIAYGNADGLDVSTIPNTYTNTVRGCRAWSNSDDGFDFWASEGIVYIENCWAWSNGYREDGITAGGDGNGFKLGQVNETTATTRRYVYNCIGALNRINNFSHNVVDPQVLTCEIYNCFSYGAVEYAGYQFNWGAEAATNSILRNNISYNDTGGALLDSWITNDHNSWNSGYTVTSADFVSTDASQLSSPRLVDGALPSITFGHLVSGSDLINTGIDVGLPYAGIAPDLGPFEFSTTFYIDPSGVDTAGRNGSIGQEWATLAYACTRAVSVGDVIHVAAGTYTETMQSVLAEGVSITGVGITSIITTAAALNPIIYAASPIQNSPGNQSISSLAFDGDNVAVMGIHVRARSNVIVHDCSFIDFTDNGLRFTGLVSGSGEPANYSRNNSAYNCTFTNCGSETFSDPYYFASAALGLSGQQDALVYNNNIDNSLGNYAYGINTNGIGYNRGLIIHDNNILVSPKHVASNQWQFSIELWTCRGGVQIYNNTVSGGIDFGGVSTTDTYGYGFAVMLHDNNIELAALQASDHTGVIIESDISGGVYVFNNTIKNFSYGLTMNALSGPTDTMSDIYIHYNLFIETTRSTADYTGRAIATGVGVSFSNIYIYNNTHYTYSFKASAGFHFATAGAIFNNINIRNNIFNNAYNAIRFENNTINGAQFTNNLFYQHNGAITYVGVTQSGVVEANNILAQDPLFISGVNYHLQALSPCRDAGINVGLLTDYDGVAILGLPDIGAFEYIEYLVYIPSIHRFGII